MCFHIHLPLFFDISKSRSFVTAANWTHTSMKFMTPYEVRNISLCLNEQNYVMLEVSAYLELYEKYAQAMLPAGSIAGGLYHKL